MATSTYYLDELNKIVFTDEFGAHVKFTCQSGATNWIHINEESARVIIDRLKKEFDIV